MGQNKDLHAEMLQYREQAVDQCLQAGKHSHVKVAFTQRVDMKRSKELELEDAEDLVYDVEHYKSLYGDPMCNGLGHKVVSLPGEQKQSVIVPTAPVRKIKRRTKLSAEMTTTVADGEQMEFGEDTSTKLQNDLFASFDITRGIGASLDSLLTGGGAARIPAEAKKTPTKAESPPTATGDGGGALQAFSLGPCNLAPLFGAASQEPSMEPSKLDSKAGKRRKPSQSSDPAAVAKAGAKKGRPGMDLALVTKSHVEACARGLGTMHDRK